MFCDCHLMLRSSRREGARAREPRGTAGSAVARPWSWARRGSGPNYLSLSPYCCYIVKIVIIFVLIIIIIFIAIVL